MVSVLWTLVRWCTWRNSGEDCRHNWVVKWRDSINPGLFCGLRWSFPIVHGASGTVSNKVFCHGMGNGVRKGCTRMRNLGRKSSPFWSSSFISHPFFMRLSRRPIVAVLKEIDIRWQAVSSSENENLQCSWNFVGKRDWNWGFLMWRLPNQLILLFPTCTSSRPP